jgi:1-acyl-sn-glycerol-3-phosphate acyltransferase
VRTVLSKLYLLWVSLVFIFFMLFVIPFVFLPFILGERLGGRLLFIALAGWSVIFGYLNFIRFKVKGKNKLDKKQSYIYTSNHSSYLDVVSMVQCVPGQFRPLAKIELSKIPVFGLIVRSACVLVDRGSNESRKASLAKLKEKIRSGISIFIFPEGKMNRTENLLAEFYDGAFRIAIETETPVVPMVILNARNLMPRQKKIVIRPGTIYTIFGDPIDVSGYTLENQKELKEKVYKVMHRMIEENMSRYFPGKRY